MNTNQSNLLIIDLDKLREHGLNLNDYYYLYCAYNKINIDPHLITEYSYQKLLSIDWIGNSKFEDIFMQNDCFEELLAHYPKQTPSGRKLHTDLNKAKELYNKKLKKNKTLQNIIIEAILTERRQRKERDTEEYFNNIYKYIKEENWKAYGPTREVITTEEINLL